jgi:hypothetical protein
MYVARTRTRLVGIFIAVALSVGVAAAPASAQTQTGLVNVIVANNTVQVPIAVAANICNVQVGVLAQGLRQGNAQCNAQGIAIARQTGGGAGGGTTTQNGLVNLAITNNTIQVPVGIAANLCNIQAGVLAADLRQGQATCTAVANARAVAV